MKTIRERLSNNAHEFDTIVSELIKENDALTAKRQSIEYPFIHDKACEITKMLEKSYNIAISEQLHYDIKRICSEIAWNEQRK